MANDWQRFYWNLDRSLGDSRPVQPPFIFRAAEAADLAAVLKVTSSALLMERTWTNSNTLFSYDLEKRCEQAFAGDLPACMVVQHGSRVVGASVLDFDEQADFHLITGPCILHEYRSRGFGTALLQQSLERLLDEGLKRVSALARVNSTAARFVYPKFGGVAEPFAVPSETQIAA